jgi:hypothetical protein
MAARSKKPGDIVIWIENIIASCTNSEQELAAKKLIMLFDARLKKENYPEYLRILIGRSLRSKLELRDIEKFRSL